LDWLNLNDYGIMTNIITPESISGAAAMKMIVFLLIVILSTMPGPARAETQADLDQACEDARAKKLEPVRRQKISECKADKKNDPKWCERYWADYGDGGRDGPNVRRRRYDDLPECVKAEKARQDVN